MQPRFMKVLVITLLISAVFTAFAPAPTLTQTSAGTYDIATTTYRLSKRPEILGSIETTDNVYTYSVYDSVSGLLVDSTAFTVTGTGWTDQSITKDALTCLIIKDATTYKTLKFTANPPTITEVSPSVITTAPTTSLSIKENCKGAYVDGVLKIFGNASAVIPTGWVQITTSDSLAYGVANGATVGSLYRVNANTGIFTQIYNFTKKYDAYSFKTAPGKLIVTGVVLTTTGTIATGTTAVDVTQTFFVFSDPAVGNFTLLGQFDISGTVYPAAGSLLTDANRYLIDFRVSAGLSKLVVIYHSIGTSGAAARTTLFKSIDWLRGVVNDVTFKNSVAFTETSKNLAYDNFDLAISDNFFVINNQSQYVDATTPIVEEAYQFIGNVLTFFRQRAIGASDPENSGITIEFIDNALITDCNSIVVTTTTNGYEFTLNKYSSLAAVTRPVIAAATPYITFTIPVSGYTLYSPPNSLAWVYKKITAAVTGPPAVAASTAAAYFRYTPNATATTNFITITEASQTGSVTVKAINDICHIETSAETPTHKVIFRTASSASPPVLTNTAIDITTVLGSTVTSGTWTLANDCSKFAVGGNVYYLNDAKTAYVLYPGTIPAFTAFDQNLNMALLGVQVYVVVPGTITIANIFNYTGTFLTNTRIYSDITNGKVVIVSTSSSSVRVLAYSVNTNTGNFTNCINYFDNIYTATPNVYVSPGLSKILITGLITGPIQKYNAFHVDYTNKQYVNITLPSLTVGTFANLKVALYDQYLYLKEDIQCVFAFVKDVSALQISMTTLTSTQRTEIDKAVLINDPNGKTYFLIQSTSSTTVTVNQLPVSVQQAILNSQLATAVGPAVFATTMTTSGQLKVCAPGCADCSSGECTSCISGFLFDTNGKICNPCGPNCLSCASDNFQACTACVPGTITSGTTCAACDSSCVTCNGATSSDCLTCVIGKSIFGGAPGSCSACPRNCATCSSSILCLTCLPGFIVGSDSLCSKGCSASCSSCLSSDITTCTSCGTGLYLLSGKCLACGASCLTCSDANTCSVCVAGFAPNSNNKCVLSCQLPCQTCADNQPSVCTSCYAGSNLSGSTCVIDTTCNGTGTCTDCGQGLNLYLDASTKKCLTCPNITNCLQCSTSSYSNCAKCATGYYIDSSYGCTACPSTCPSCISSTTCTSCIAGYTIPLGSSTGTCTPCTSPCATCQGSSTVCLSCVDGYTKTSWKCQRNKNVAFNFVLTGTPSDILAAIDSFVTYILSKLPEDPSNRDVVTVTSAVTGSTVLTGTITPSDATTSSSTIISALSSIPTGTAFGSSTVTSASFSAQGESSSSTTTDDNKALIVGLVVGLTLGVTVIVLIIVIIVKSKAASSIGQVSSGELHVQVKEDSLQEAQLGKAPSANKLH